MTVTINKSYGVSGFSDVLIKSYLSEDECVKDINEMNGNGFILMLSDKPHVLAKANSDGTWSMPSAQELEPTIQEKIDALESKVTSRMIRGAALGKAKDIELLTAIENSIEVLRTKL